MAATVNASTSAGVVITPDNSGVLALQSSSTTALTIDASQNSTFVGTASATKLIPTGSSATGNGLYLPAANSLGLSTNGTNAVYIDSSQNVGIGTASLAAKLTVQVTSVTTLGAQASSGLIIAGGGSNNNLCQIALGYGTTYAPVAISSITTTQTGNTIADLIFATRSVNTDTAPTERMRITSSGAVCVATTSQFSSALISVAADMNALFPIVIKNTVTQSGGHEFMRFLNSANAKAGSIDHTGTTTVAYTTSSDYRMKENIAPMTGALTAVLQLKPCTYTWKEDGKVGQGFIAHELQEVCPDCVSGNKDAIDEHGNPEYQGIDTSFLVATLTAAIQELKAINDTQAATITALTARIVALENK